LVVFLFLNFFLLLFNLLQNSWGTPADPSHHTSVPQHTDWKSLLNSKIKTVLRDHVYTPVAGSTNSTNRWICKQQSHLSSISHTGASWNLYILFFQYWTLWLNCESRVTSKKLKILFLNSGGVHLSLEVSLNWRHKKTPYKKRFYINYHLLPFFKEIIQLLVAD
jgi:hypothetical protein